MQVLSFQMAISRRVLPHHVLANYDNPQVCGVVLTETTERIITWQAMYLIQTPYFTASYGDQAKDPIPVK